VREVESPGSRVGRSHGDCLAISRKSYRVKIHGVPRLGLCLSSLVYRAVSPDRSALFFANPPVSPYISYLCFFAEAIGEVQEWLNWHAWKACVRESVPWVRIPPSPRHARLLPGILFFLYDGGRRITDLRKRTPGSPGGMPPGESHLLREITRQPGIDDFGLFLLILMHWNRPNPLETTACWTFFECFFSCSR
jgi:hypothetical protein